MNMKSIAGAASVALITTVSAAFADDKAAVTVF